MELRLIYLSRTQVVARCASDTCFLLEAFENQDSTTVAFSTWYCSRNTSIQVFSIVIVLRIELQQYYLYRTVVVARFASDTSIRLEAFENQNSTTVAYSTSAKNGIADILPFQNHGGSEMRLRHVLSIRSVREQAFQHRCLLNMVMWTKYLNAMVFPIVTVPRIVLRLFCLSRTVVEARCASDTCFLLEAFENQDSTTVAYSTW
ncbi:hypothetical protein ANTQUA_LOCUS3475 [Anthophora quadrimaculata]